MNINPNDQFDQFDETPYSPNVIADDLTKSIIGFDPNTMEASVSTDGGVMFSHFSSVLPDLSGEKEVQVRVRARGGKPASPATILNFTEATPTYPIPAPEAMTKEVHQELKGALESIDTTKSS